MDAQVRKKALYRAKLNAHKLAKRIESPLVRYNEYDQPVCVVCDVVLKSESLWPAHQISRKHHEAVNNLKANAAALNRTNSIKPEPSSELPKLKPEPSLESCNNKPEPFTGLPKPRPSSGLPADFFDNPGTKRQKIGVDAPKLRDPDSHKKVQGSAQTQVERFDSKNNTNGSSSVNVVDAESYEIHPARDSTQTSKTFVGSENKQTRRALPEGFFDDKDADLRARGITLVKPDVKDEYKEFEKLIQEDLKEVDNRLEEDEFDAAEMIEELESAELRSYKERVEMLKSQKVELRASRSAMHEKGAQVPGKESSCEESSSDDDSDENFTVDWRAKHL